MIENNPNIKSLMRSSGRSYSVRSNRDRFFFPDEWMKFIDNSKSRQKFTFEFLINTGSRINEARNVKVSDIDLDRKRIVLRITKIKAKKKEKAPRPRIIPISSQFAKSLKKYIKDKKLSNEDYLGILSTPAANIGMKKSLQNAKIKDWQMFSIHNIRKTLEVWLMALSVDGLTITAHVGHSMQTAAGHYVSPDVFSWEEKTKMREIIGDLYRR
jgi:integrase